MEWRAFFYCITCSCRREALSVGGQSSNPILYGSFGTSESNVRACCRTGQKKTRVVMPFPEGFQFSSCYRSALAVFGPLTWSLNVVDGYELSRMSVALLIDWCPRMSHALRRYFQLFQPWICRAVVEVVYNDFGAETWGISWRYGWAGLQFLFRSEIWKFYLFEPRKFNRDLLPRCCRPFWLSAFHRPWHRGLILNARLPRRFLMSNVTRIIDKIWQDPVLTGTWKDRYVLPHFPYT